MTATAADHNTDLSGKGSVGDRAFGWATYASGGAVLLILGAIALTMTRRAWPAFDQMGLEFFTSQRWAPSEGIFGACGQPPRTGELFLETAEGRRLPSGVFARWPN